MTTALSELVVDEIVPGPAGGLAVRARGLRPDARAAVVLVHGAVLTGQTAFDPPVGPPDLALLRVIADLGAAAVTFAVRGYHGSDAPADPLAISTEDAITDLAAVIEWTRAQTGLERVSILGWSWGGRVAARYTQDHADAVDRLILLDPAIGGTPPMPERVPTEPWHPLSVDDFSGRIEPEFTEPGVADLIAHYAAEHDVRTPTGAFREVCQSPQPPDPTAITRPTLMVYGQAAAQADYMRSSETRESFFGRLATDERVFAIVPDGGDYLHFQRGRFRLHEHLAAFLRPALAGATR